MFFLGRNPSQGFPATRAIPIRTKKSEAQPKAILGPLFYVKMNPVSAPAISYAAFGRRGLKKDRQYWKALRHDLFYRMISGGDGLRLESFGRISQGYGWTICPKNLDQNSIVVSGGVGHDISFELGLIQRFGCKILLLDPSPTGIATMALPENQHPNLKFLPLAMTGQNGPITFHEPTYPEEGSFSSFVGRKKGLEVEGISLPSLTKKHGLGKIDLLKMDIEGSEYEVIDSILKNKVQICQICVEYHNQVLPGIRTSWTVASLLRLWRQGWRVIHKDGSNHTLWNKKTNRSSKDWRPETR